MRQEIQTLLNEQLSSWELAQTNYAALKQVKVKELTVNGTLYKVQFNPERIVSSAAKVDTQSIQERKCFLCPAHLPTVQKGLSFKKGYQILVNPFPIFPRHLTVPALEHVEQRILARFGDILDLAAFATDYVVFYNGPRCGASAPDHVHFQAGNKGFLPIEKGWKYLKASKVVTYKSATLWHLNEAPRATLVMEATIRKDAVELFEIVYNSMELKLDEEEPMMNLLAWIEKRDETHTHDGTTHWVVCIFPREKHRPSCYAAEGDANILISPASVDMGGVFITPREKDFEKLGAEEVATILSEVCLSPIKFQQLRQRIKEQL